ncbi:MAG: glycosyltransferase family 9 protein [Endomicrobium sp.]|jgi:ADP-heptose:LPS heptosyltransferase|nr:glycosyltransferase family 9 protein [Endomicrobium sp.]
MKILIIKPSSFGDIIQALPCANALKLAYHACEITWVVFSDWEPLLKMCTDVDKIILWDRKKGLKGFWETLRQVKSVEYDLIIDLQGLLRSAFLAKFASAKIKIGVPGMKEFSSFLIKEVYPKRAMMNATLRNLETVRFLTGKTFSPKINIKISDESQKIAKIILRTNGLLKDTCSIGLDEKNVFKQQCDKQEQISDFIALLPFARGKGKDWGVLNYHKLVDLIEKKYSNMYVVVLGSVQDFGKIQSNKVIDLCGKTGIEELASILLQSRVTIGADTGPMHLSAVLQRPSVFIFGSSNSNETSPCIGNFSVVIDKNNPKNINAIKPESVFVEITKWIK